MSPLSELRSWILAVVALDAGVVEDRPGIVDGQVGGRDVPGDAALEVDAQHQAALPQRQPADHQQRQARWPSTTRRRPQKSMAVWPRISRRQRVVPIGRPGRGGGCFDVGGHAGGAPSPNWSWRSRRPVAGHQDDRRAGEEPQHDDVADRRHAEVQGEAADRPDAEHEQHGGGDERHEVGGEDRPPRRLEAAGRRVLERAAVQRPRPSSARSRRRSCRRSCRSTR